MFIPEQEIESFFYKRSAEWCKSIMAADGIWWGFQDHTFVESYNEWIHWFWKNCAPEELSVRLLSNQSDIEKQMKKRPYPRRHIKFWKGDARFTATIWINGDYIVMVNTKEHSYYVIEIHDVLLAHNLREVCKGIWNEKPSLL